MPGFIARARKNDPEGTRRRVLDIAARCFQAGGYAGTSMQDVVHGAEVSAGALHHHFPTKKELGLAVIRERVLPDVQATWIEPLRAGLPLADALVGVFRDTAELLDDRGSVAGCPLNNLAIELALGDEDFRRILTHGFQSWQDAIEERMSTELPVTASAARDLAAAIVAMFSGAMAMAKTGQSSAALKSCANVVSDMVVNAARDGLPVNRLHAHGATRPS